MKILVDENIPLARDLFGSLGDVTMVGGREIGPDFPGLAGFDALAIRSVTKVTPALVERAGNARFIGTATIGTDHIDLAYIDQANARRADPIAVVSAPGSNADSVADYVWYALLRLWAGSDRPICERTLGIVGHGNCGSRVAKRAAGFGVNVRRYDPPLAERSADFVSDAFEETIQADAVTLHVPLTREGECAYPTHHMIGANELRQMNGSVFLVNSSRGAVVDSDALIDAVTRGAIAGTALDVYESEPEPPEDLIRLPAIATPHIAGYAVEAKRRGAVVIYEAMCRAFGRKPRDTTELLMQGFSPPAEQTVEFASRGGAEIDADQAVSCFLAATYDIDATSAELKATLGRDSRGELFDRMRKNYEHDYGRHELAAYRVGFHSSVPSDVRERVRRRLAGFGTQTVEQDAHYVLAML